MPITGEDTFEAVDGNPDVSLTSERCGFDDLSALDDPGVDTPDTFAQAEARPQSPALGPDVLHAVGVTFVGLLLGQDRHGRPEQFRIRHQLLGHILRDALRKVPIELETAFAADSSHCCLQFV